MTSGPITSWQIDGEKVETVTRSYFQVVVLENILESPLDSKDIKPVNPKGNQPRILIRRSNAEAEAPILWPPDVKSWLIWKDPDAGKDWGQEEKGFVKAVYCHPAYLTYMQITSRETLVWMKHNPESGSRGAISVTSDMPMTPPLWQKVKRN